MSDSDATSQQPALFAAEDERPRTIQERFEQFHAANPEVYERLVAKARQLKAAGRHRTGINMLWEVLRYEYLVTTDPDSEFKLNDHYPSRYVRLIVAQEPDLAEMFEIRRLKAS